VEYGLIVDAKGGILVKHVTDALDTFAKFCGVDIFILGPKLTPVVDGLNGDVEVIRDQRWRVAIFGDTETSEHAKTQVLIFIDKLVGSHLKTLPGQT
jgi:hypothetical protein